MKALLSETQRGVLLSTEPSLSSLPACLALSPLPSLPTFPPSPGQHLPSSLPGCHAGKPALLHGALSPSCLITLFPFTQYSTRTA